MRKLWLALFSGVISLNLLANANAEESAFQIGWIGALSGPHVKYGSGQAALLAQDDVNAEGGVLGKRLELIMEDGQGKGTAALSAFQKLVNYHKLKFIVGGSCTPESGAIAPLAEQAGVVLLASVTSSPKFTAINPNFFRITAPSVVVGDLLSDYAIGKAGIKRLGIIYEETDYVMPVATRVEALFREKTKSAVQVMSFTSNESDFRALLTKLRAARIDGLFVGAQSKDTARLLLKQLHETRLTVPLLGNEQVGNGAIDDASYAKLFEGVIFAEPVFDPEAPDSKSFSEKFKKRFNVESLPTGFWTAEAYDAVRLMAKAINECGADVKAVKDCLLKIKEYRGASGVISINAQHDGVRQYVLKRVAADGKPVVME